MVAKHGRKRVAGLAGPRLHAWKIWSDYLKRSNIERSIRELLHDLALSKIPTQSWTANVAFFQLLLFAYNLLHWFKRLCFAEHQLGKTADTLRHQFIELPAKLTRTAGKNVLHLPRAYPHKQAFLKAMAAVNKLKKLCAR